MSDKTPPASEPHPFSSPVQFLAFGFGSGLAPKAPGTFGTAMAIPLYLLMALLPMWQYSVLIVVTFALGI